MGSDDWNWLGNQLIAREHHLGYNGDMITLGMLTGRNYVCVYMYVYIYICIRKYIYTYTYIHMYIYIYTYKYLMSSRDS